MIEQKKPIVNIFVYDSTIADRDAFIRDIKVASRMQGVSKYLVDEQHYIENPQWSEPFVANVSPCIMHNDELDYLAINSVENNCKKYYKKVHATIYTTETNIGIMKTVWKNLFLFRTEDKFLFMGFVSNFTTNLTTLTQGQSPIASDSIYIHMFLYKAIWIDSLTFLLHNLLPKSIGILCIF